MLRLTNSTILRLKTELATAKREREDALRESTLLRLERDVERSLAERSLAERDSIKAAFERYNPEVINRQEELCNIEKLHRPALSCPLRGDPLTRMRQGLTYLGVRRGPNSHLVDGQPRYQQFWDWLTTRPEIEAANEYASYAGHVNAQRALPAFSEEANRVCKSRSLFVDTLAFWRKEPADKHYGVFICSDYKYDPTKRVWIRTDEAYACGEQTREVFFAQGGKTYYAGTYMCHTGPAHLRVHHLGELGNENLLQAIASTTHGGGKHHGDEKQAITELYREGTLTVRVLGLERIGFNRQLYNKLTAQCRRREGEKAQRRKDKRKRCVYTGPPLPAPVIPGPVWAALAPPAPAPYSIGMKRGREEYDEDDEYDDDEDDQPWKVQKIEDEEEDEGWEESEELEPLGQYYGEEEDYEEEEYYEEEEHDSPIKFEDCEY